MSAGTFDTLAIARRLKSAGFSEDQAEAVTGVLREVRDTDVSTLATKTDLDTTKDELRREIAEVKSESLKWVLPAIGFQTIVNVGAVVALARGLR